MGALTDRYKAILKKQAWHKRLMEWHKDSHPLTKNEDGTPKVFYHGTGADFDTFDRGDIGFHFGTQKSANDRLRHTNKIDYGNIMPVYLKAKNLIRLKDMRFWYDTAKIAKELYKESILNKDEKNQFTTNIYDKNAKMSNLREILLSKGYDGIIYKNAVENKGEDSFIVLSPNQIKSIHNKGTFDENSAVITDSVTLDSPVKSKLQKEKRGIWNVTFNGKNSTAIYKDIDFIDDAIKFEQGKADYIDNKGNFKNGFGVLHIVKHIGKNQDGWVSEKEIVNIGVAIRNTKPYIKSGKRIYEYYNNFGDRFKIIIGDKKNGERTISFYSNRKAGFGNDSQNYIYNQPFGRRGGSHNAQPATSSTDTIIPKNTNQVNMDGAETMNILQQIKTETSVLAKTKLVKEWRSLGVADKAKIIKEYRNEIKEDYIEIKNIRAEYIKHISIDQFKKEYLIIRKPPKKFFTKTNHDIFVSPKNKEIFNFKKMVFSPRHVSTGLYKRGLMNLLSYFNLTKFGATIKGNIDGVDVVLGTVIEGKISIEDAYRNHGELIDFANSLKIRQLRIEGESSAVITDSVTFDMSPHRHHIAEKMIGIPQEIEKFGRNFTKFKGKPIEAIEHLIKVKNGQVRGAIYKEGIGDIDFIWGKILNPKKHTGYGLAHIIDKHGVEVARKLPKMINSLPIKNKTSNGVILEDTEQAERVSIQLKYIKKSKIWVLTAYNLDDDSSVVGDTATSMHLIPTLPCNKVGASKFTQIIPKNTNQVNMDGALTDRYKVILKKQAWHKRLMEWHKDSHPLTKNADGTPKVSYHGTGADFDTFEVGHGGDFGDGVYFSDSPEYSSEYGNSVYPVNLNIKEPLVLDNRYQMNRLWDEKIAAKDSGDKAALGAMSEWLKSKGYDGIIVSNGLTGDSSGVSFGIVFNPNQIKSIHNKGTFSENSAVITDSVTFDMSFDAESRYIDKSRDMIKINKLIKDAEETLPQPIRSFEDFKKQFPEADTDNNVKLNIHGVSIEFNLYGVWKHLVPQNNTHYDDRNTISGAFVKTIRDPLLIVRQPHKGREIVFYKAFRGSPLYNLAAFKFTNGKFTYYDLKNNMNKVKEIIKTPDQNTLYFKYSRQEKILRTKEWQSEPAINQIIPKNTNKINMDGAETMNIQELPHETVQMDMAFISTMLTNKELKEKETELKEKYEKANSMIAKSKIIKELSDLATIEEGAFSDVATKTAMKEIDDSEISFSLVPRNAKNITLGDIMEAPLLFSKYPQLRNIKIKHLGARSIYNGQYRPSENALYISPPDLDKEEEKKIDERIDSVKDKEIEIIFGDKKTMLKIMTTNQSEASESYINKARRYLDFLSNLKKQEEKEKNRLSRTYEPQKSIILHELQHAIQEIENWGKGGVPKNKSAKAYEEYRRLWGEQQARAAQHRMDMTKEEKQKESWQDTLKRVEKKYDNPIVKLNHGNSAVITDSITFDMSPANKISKAKKNAHMVASGHKDFKQVGKDKDGNILIFEKGNTWVIRGEIRGYGLDKIVAKHILHQKDLTYEDIVNSPEIKKHSEEYIAKNGNTVFDFPSKANPIFKIVFGTATDNKRNKRLLKNGSEFKTLKSMYQMSANGRLSPIIPNPEFDSVSVSLSSEFSELNTHDTIIPKNTNQVNMDGAETMNILQQIKTETGLLAKKKLLKQWRSLGLLQRKKALKEYNASTSTVNDDVIDALETIKAVLENPDATSPLQNTQRVL